MMKFIALLIKAENLPQNGNSFSQPLIGSQRTVAGPNNSYPESQSYRASLSPSSNDFVCTLAFTGTAGGPQTEKKS